MSVLWRDGDYGDLLGPASAREVTTPDGKVLLVVSDVQHGIPDEVQWRVGPSAGLLSIIGGAAIRDESDKRAMLEFFTSVCGGHLVPGLTLLGAGNRVVHVPAGSNITNTEEHELRIDPMIMEVPGLLARLNPSCFTLGVVPRVGRMMAAYGRYSSFALNSKLGTSDLLNPTYRMVWVIQRQHGVLDWDGDIALKSALMDAVRRPQPGTTTHKPVGVMAWNGGAITSLEIRQALLDGVPLLVVRGSGRFCDDIIHYRDGKRNLVSRQGLPILDGWRDDPELDVDLESFSVADTVRGAQVWLGRHGLIAV
jgi:hypothetical protein